MQVRVQNLRMFAASVLVLSLLVAACSDDATGGGESDTGGDEDADIRDSRIIDADVGRTDADDTSDFDPRPLSKLEEMQGRNVYVFDDHKAIYPTYLNWGEWHGWGALLLLDTTQPERLRIEDYVLLKGDLWGQRVGERFIGVLDTDDHERADLIEAQIEGDQLSVRVADEMDAPTCNWMTQLPEPREAVHAVYCQDRSFTMIEFEDGRPRYGRQIDVSGAVSSELDSIWHTWLWRGGITEDQLVIDVEHGVRVFDLSDDREGSPLLDHLEFDNLDGGWAYDQNRDLLYVAGKGDDGEDENDNILILDLSDPSSIEVVGEWNPWDDLGLDPELSDSIALYHLNLVGQTIMSGCYLLSPSDEERQGICLIERNEAGDNLESLEFIPGEDLPGSPEELERPKVVGDRIYFGDTPPGRSEPDTDYEYPEVGLSSLSLEEVFDLSSQ